MNATIDVRQEPDQLSGCDSVAVPDHHWPLEELRESDPFLYGPGNPSLKLVTHRSCHRGSDGRPGHEWPVVDFEVQPYPPGAIDSVCQWNLVEQQVPK